MKSIYSFSLKGLAVLLSSSPQTLLAIVPDAGNIYYGLARDFLGKPLEPNSGIEVIMVRTDQGEEKIVARSPILSIDSNQGDINYILRPSRDDGLAGRYSESAARTGDVVEIFVIQNGVRFPISSGSDCVQISDPVPAILDRGGVVRVNFRYTDDNDGDCIADSWERFYYGTTEFDGTEDFDEDGRSSLQEFIDGTNPLFPERASPLTVSINGPVAGIFTLDWDSQEGLNYTIEWSEDFELFVPVPEERLVGPDRNQVDTSGFTSLFFRVVED